MVSFIVGIINMIIKYFSWVKDFVGKSEEIIEVPTDINTPEKLIDFLITKDQKYKTHPQKT